MHDSSLAVTSGMLVDDGDRYEGPLIRFVRGGVQEPEPEPEPEPHGIGSMEVDDEDGSGDEGAAGTAEAAAEGVVATTEGGAEMADVADVAEASEAEAAVIGRDELLGAVPKQTGEALQEHSSRGYGMLLRMGWREGDGLGARGHGETVPVAVALAALIDGVGLGCTAMPEEKVLKGNIEARILAFVADAELSELAFSPELSKADRVLVHHLSGRHNLGHRSQGHEKDGTRFITVFKKGTRPPPPPPRQQVAEEEMVQHYESLQRLGYTHHNKGVGLGFGGMHADAASASLVEQCQQQPQQPRQPPPQQQQQQQQSWQQSLQPQPRAPQAQPKPTPQPTPQRAVVQWASAVVAFSSQFSASDHAAVQLLGPSRVHPRAGSNHRAWSPVPRPGAAGREWVRLAFKQPVWPSELLVYETHHPGSLSRVRFAREAAGAHAEDSEWVEAWAATDGGGGASGGASRIFSPKLRAAAVAAAPVRLVELEIDTTRWDEATWSEFDAVKLVGVAASQDELMAAVGGGGGGGGGGGAMGGGGGGSAFLQRLPWESESDFAARADFARRRVPAAADDAAAQMRQAALSMVWANMKKLGCRYPTAVENQVGLAGGGPTGLAAAAGAPSLLALQGDLRSVALARTIS